MFTIIIKCPAPVGTPLPVPLLYRRDTTKGPGEEFASLGPIRSRQGGPPQWGITSGQVCLDGSREGGQGEAGVMGRVRGPTGREGSAWTPLVTVSNIL